MKRGLVAVLGACAWLAVVPLSTGAAEEGVSAALQLQTAFTEVADRAVPAVVVITNKRVERRAMYPQLPPELQFFFGIPQRPPQQDSKAEQVPQPAGKGSGVILRRNGYILTNYHVIKESDALEVRLHDGRVFDSARNPEEVVVVGTDEETDLAVLKIGNGKVEDLPVLTFADSDKVKIGEWAIAVGAPFNLDYSLTVGVVSQKGRYDVNMNTYENYIQTDASINPGNSGGPLLNLKGEVIGINDFIVTGGGMSRGSVGIGFAIASNLAEEVAGQLIENKEVIRPWLGIAMQPLTADLKKQFKVEQGVLISEVMKGDPADDGGLKPGDVILKIGEKEVRTPHDVQFAVLTYRPGDKVRFLIDRGGQRKSLTVVARRRSGKDTAARQEASGDMTANLGLALEATDKGVVVVQVAPGSPAEAARIMRGDLILEVNRKEVKSVEEVEKALAGSQDEMAVLYVERRGSRFFVPLSLEAKK